MTPAVRRWLDELLRDCAASPRPTTWEEQFCAELRARLIERGNTLDLSERQRAVLKKIEAKIHAAG